MWKVYFGGCDPKAVLLSTAQIWSMSGPRRSHSNWVLMLSKNVFVCKRTFRVCYLIFLLLRIQAALFTYPLLYEHVYLSALGKLNLTELLSFISPIAKSRLHKSFPKQLIGS